jgi:hypothetical protein
MKPYRLTVVLLVAAGALLTTLADLVAPQRASALSFCVATALKGKKKGQTIDFVYRDNDDCPASTTKIKWERFFMPGDFLCWDTYTDSNGALSTKEAGGKKNGQCEPHENTNGDKDSSGGDLCDARDCQAAECWDTFTDASGNPLAEKDGGKKNGICEAHENKNGDTDEESGEQVCDVRDCQAAECWDTFTDESGNPLPEKNGGKKNGKCEAHENLNGDKTETGAELCDTRDCQAAQCWDRPRGEKRIFDGICQPDENINGDKDSAGKDICDTNDCRASECWDLNKNQLPDKDSEDFNGDGQVNVDDCRTFLTITTPGGFPTLEKLATLNIVGDSNGIFSDAGNNALLIDVATSWPKANELLNDPTDCAAPGTFARTIDTAGNLQCTTVPFLGADPTDCAAPGSFARTIDAAGNLQCTTVPFLGADPTDCAGPGTFARVIDAAGNLQCTTVPFLGANPTDCTTPGTFARVIDAAGNLQCEAVPFLAADPTDCTVPGTFARTIDASGNLLCEPVSTFAANPGNCAVPGEFARGIAANGEAECEILPPPTTLASDPVNCLVAGQFARGIAANGDAQCEVLPPPTTLASDPVNCLVAGEFARGIAANGDAQCEVLPAATALNLTANPGNCTANGEFARGIDQNGMAECEVLPAATSLNLTTNPVNCTVDGQFARGIDQNGMAECEALPGATTLALTANPDNCAEEGQFARGIDQNGMAECEALPAPTALALVVEENVSVTGEGNIAIDPNENESAPQLVANDGVGTLVLDPRRERTVVFNDPMSGQRTIAFRAFEDLTIVSVNCVANPAVAAQTISLTVQQLVGTDANVDNDWTTVQTISNCSNTPQNVNVASGAVDEGRWVRVVVGASDPVDAVVNQVALSVEFVVDQSTSSSSLSRRAPERSRIALGAQPRG